MPLVTLSMVPGGSVPNCYQLVGSAALVLIGGFREIGRESDQYPGASVTNPGWVASRAPRRAHVGPSAS
ncbi:hypothetical protein BQ8420_07315 [Nocardiopsis sp. JB363]|nr:hypothetical protein BQ8420_07315 [Nocardiopsis sp. JB363]